MNCCIAVAKSPAEAYANIVVSFVPVQGTAGDKYYEVVVYYT